MTREEAIRGLKAIKQFFLFTYPEFEESDLKAIDMAIYALRQPPNDNWERYSDFLWKEAYERGKQEALKDRPQGEWVAAEHQDPSDIINGNLLYICSNCGVGDLHATKQNVPYCWHCGADMRGEE